MEKRFAPRHDERLPVDFFQRLAVEVEGIGMFTTNVSRGGIQVSCPEPLMDSIRVPIQTGLLELVISLPDSSNVRAACVLRYEVCHADECLLGLRFETFADDGHAQRWLAYVGALQGNAE